MSNHILGPGKHTVGENWILGLKPPMPFPSSPQDIVLPRPTMPSLPPHPPLSQPPPSPLSLPPPSQLPEAQQSYNPALHGRGYPHTPADLQHVMPSQAEGPSDKPSIAVGLSVRNIYFLICDIVCTSFNLLGVLNLLGNTRGVFTALVFFNYSGLF